MLIEFRVSNFRSFKDEQVLSMVASGSEKAHPENTFSAGGLDLLKSAAIYGPNAAGKSNLVRAFRCMRNLVKISATELKPDSALPYVVAHKLSSMHLERPSEFSVVFLLEGIRYEYGFSATSEKVWKEWLYSYPKGKKRIELDRSTEPDSGNVTWVSKWVPDSELTMLKDRTRDNCLALSRGADLRIKPFEEVYRWLSVRTICLDLSLPVSDLVDQTLDFINKAPKLAGQVLRLIKEADLGISRVDLDEVKADQEGARKALEILGPLLERIAEETGSPVNLPELSETVLRAQVFHRSTDSSSDVPFALEDESNGTVRLLAIAGPVLLALELGNVVVLDELGCSMHPELTRKIIELFHSDINTKGAQLIFTTHDLLTMDPSLLRRDQVWLVEKDKGGATELFSLSDVKGIRKNEAFMKRYLAGSYGALPDFGQWLESPSSV